MKNIRIEIAEKIKIRISCKIFSENRATYEAITKQRAQRENPDFGDTVLNITTLQNAGLGWRSG
jgi:hypothetical protein